MSGSSSPWGTGAARGSTSSRARDDSSCASSLDPASGAGENAGLASEQTIDAFVIAIDGPAGAGKSTVARRLAEALEGFRYLDTGAMYRAVTAYLLRVDKLNVSEAEMAGVAEGLALDGEALRVHGADVTDGIRKPEVTAEVSRISAYPLVRRVVQRKQREQTGRLVAEGRDIGSIVFPEAQVKIYLDASLRERAERRQRQFPDFDREEYERRIARRDEIDSTREDSPLVRAEDAIVIDTTDLTIDEVVSRVLALVEERLDQGGDSTPVE